MRILVTTLALMLCFSTTYAGSFTVDERSALHIEASAIANTSCNGMFTLANGASTTKQRAVCAALVFGAGLVKEFAVDGHPDYGDIFFNAVGIALSDQIVVHLFPVQDGGGAGIILRY